MSGSIKTISSSEVAKHNTKHDLWTVIHNHVYNLSSYIEEHPGGIPILLEKAGQDSTEAFEDVGHTSDAREVMEKFLIGQLPDEEQINAPVHTKPDVQPRAVHAGYFDGQPSRSHTAWGVAGLVASTVVTGSIIVFGARFISQLNLLHTSGGFWKGFGISSVTGIFFSLAATAYVSRQLQEASKDNRKWPAHYKPRITIAKQKPLNSGVLQPHEFRSFPLLEKTKVSSDTFRFVFGLPSENAILGLPTGQHVHVRHHNDKGEIVTRSYTPTSSNHQRGRMELIVKTYPDGFMSQYLANLKLNEKADFRGPGGKMKYTRYLTNEIGMMAGGSGITPMYTIIKAICENDKDDTHISLLYANKTENDILLKKELDSFAQKCPHKFQVEYVLSDPPAGWTGSTGRISKALAEKRMPKANGDLSKIMLCGPPSFQNAMRETMVDLGFKKPGTVANTTDEIFIF